MNMRSISDVYESFKEQHYVREPLRNPAQVEAVLEAAGIHPQEVTSRFWDELNYEWLWGASLFLFCVRRAGRVNAQYLRLCALKGTQP